MAITLLTLKGSGEVSDVHVDVTDYEDSFFVLKQYDYSKEGEWIAITKPMLLQLRDWITKEFG